MTALKDIKFFTTHEHDCSYLEDQQARTLFVDPLLKADRALHSQLSDLGFRRSGSHIYRPNCVSCQQCISCRVLVKEFLPRRRFRKIWLRNQDLQVTETTDLSSEKFYQLYKKYIEERHHGLDMYPPSREQYQSFLLAGTNDTSFNVVRLGEKVLAVMVIDRLESGLSAVYTFYDPTESQRSLGTFCILWQIQYACQLSLNYLYLGYWVRDCHKMNYKVQFQPMELLSGQRWLRMP
jgi:arginyl-tRNA--protein-N-Asp/Glu arginylyltransferase